MWLVYTFEERRGRVMSEGGGLGDVGPKSPDPHLLEDP